MNTAAHTVPPHHAIHRTPKVPGWPLIGSLPAIAKDPAQFFVDCYRKYGPVFRLSVLGKPYVTIAGIEAANFLGTRAGKDCLRSKEFWEGLVKEYGATRILTGEDGESHKELRDIMRHGYSKEALKGRYEELVGLTNHAIERDWPVGRSVPVVEAMQYMVTEQLGTIVTGSAPLEYIKDIRTMILYILNVLVTRQRPMVLLKDPRYKKAKARVFELGEKMIRDVAARAGKIPEDQKILVDDIYEAHLKTPHIMPASDLIVALTGPYVAGLDTVANTTAAILYTVLKHPEVKARVLKEVDALFAEGNLEGGDLLKRIPSLHGAVMETMRMYPIAVAQMRTATKDFVFEGHQIHKGEMVYIATSVPHFMEEYFPNPKTFDIDRYSKERAEHMQSGAYSPFGRGPHTCLGKSAAEILLPLTMACLFYRLDLELDPPGYVLKTKTAPTPGPAMDFKVRVKGYRH
ncbi:cytochrome P450 [Sinimarinibacterium sp. CAU 1509]|uniref:cytochrome P450 n=1 Tax=Sinimarinibacterium sp. CAU 1509 TaxID=2562283 RepID=UPI0010ABD67E|nr:cytochrome P450 [Sinimarinibacterium sp. CAU 1509]TJY58248.1 cytochrome P450 [Sinimarinibacterium sp. CAU 1509]